MKYLLSTGIWRTSLNSFLWFFKGKLTFCLSVYWSRVCKFDSRPESVSDNNIFILYRYASYLPETQVINRLAWDHTTECTLNMSHTCILIFLVSYFTIKRKIQTFILFGHCFYRMFLNRTIRESRDCLQNAVVSGPCAKHMCTVK